MEFFLLMDSQIDWEAQWAAHSPKFINGYAHVDLPKGQKLRLLPGPGFGDFSHPTTRLMVQLMADQLEKKIVFDIGCGSGILSVAAKKLGAFKIYCCDIDPDAVVHSQKNAALNQTPLATEIPRSFPEKPVILMNMISSEQSLAWSNYKCPFDTLITSGILTSEKNLYLQFAESQRWQLTKSEELDGWLGFIFKESPHNE